jgi:hypothetical protein
MNGAALGLNNGARSNVGPKGLENVAKGSNPGLNPTAPSGRIRLHEKTRN